MNNQIDLFVNDLEERITAECEKLKKEASPKVSIKKYIHRIRWKEPELAAYLLKRMESELGGLEARIERFNIITTEVLMNIVISMAVASFTTILVMISQTK